MKTFIKRLAMLLIIVLSTESVMADTVISNGSSDIISEVSSIFDSEHSEPEAETTTEGIEVTDEVITPSGVIVDLLAFLRNLKSDIIKDGVVSPSAIDYEIDNDNLPDNVIALLSEEYRNLNETERFLLNRYLSVREDTMTVCGEKGLDAEGSVPYALIMQIMQADFDDARAMVISNESETKAVETAYGFGNLFMEKGNIIDDELKSQFIEYAAVGYSADEVFNAYIFSIIIDRELSEVIYDKRGNEGETAFLTEYEDTAAKYCINQSAIEAYLNMGYRLDMIEGCIKMTLEEMNKSEAVLYSADDDNFDVGYDSSFKEGALSYIDGIGDSIDPSTGVLTYSSNICSLPGINGLDLNLTINYTSSTTNMAKEIDRRVNLASNWSFNLPYLSNENENGDLQGFGPKYITLENGDTYELIGSGDEYVPVNCLTDKLVLKKDVSKKGGASSAFYLVNKNGDVKYFTERGRWIKTENRFGNSIKAIEYPSSGTNLIIEDTVGRQVTIKESSAGDGTITQTIIMPDGNSTKIVYKSVVCGGHKKTQLLKITDSENNTVSFVYDTYKNDNYKNALIREISMPTGIKNCYEYIWSNKPEISFEYSNYEQIISEDDWKNYEEMIGDHINDVSNIWQINIQEGEYEYARISKKYTADTGNNKFKQTTYSYSGSYVYADAYFNVFCGCMKWDYKYLFKYDEDGNLEVYYVLCYSWDCDCIYYYNGSEWLCKNDGCIGNIVLKNDNYSYATAINEENGLKTVYTFNQKNQNTGVNVYDGNTLIKKVTTNYYLSSTKSNLPQTVTDIEYQNGTESNKTIQEYEYTNLNDVKKYTVKSGNKELANIKYEYDYNNNTSEYYGICTKTTTKMNSSENIVEENILENSGLFKNKAVKSNTVKRNGTLESKTEYERGTYGSDLGRITRVLNTISGSSSISTYYVYIEGQVNPESVTAGVTGENYRTEYSYDENERIIAVSNPEGYVTKYEYNKIGDITKAEYYKDRLYNSDANTNGRDKDTVSFAYNYAENKITFTNENGNKEIYDYDAFGNPASVTKGGAVLLSYTYDTRLRPATYTEGKA
ncbi:MAG: hypothetical protein Q4D26_08440, partial [Clostridia bacterium]|nr:hypothetical protein [Clostridia bacterium]